MKPASFATRENRRLFWESQPQATSDLTQWHQVTLPGGFYESFHLEPRYAGRAFISVYAKTPALVAGEVLEESAWLGEDTVPGPGDQPTYLKVVMLSARSRDYKLGGRFYLGTGSLLRASFNPLPHVPHAKGLSYRAGVVRLGAYKVP